MDLPKQKVTPISGEDSETRILAVVVLYKLRPEESVTVRTLARAMKAAEVLPVKMDLVLFDNTPEGQEPGPLPDGARYQAAPDNPGLAVAYNSALATACAEGYLWLLTLDQDTNLPENFLTALLPHVRKYSPDERIAAIVPRVRDSGRYISPFRFVGGFLPAIIRSDFSGITELYTSAINSSALLRVSALQEVCGYDKRFPLNNSDTSLFHRLGASGKRVVLAGDVLVDHELAIMDRGKRMTVERYTQLLIDERALWDLHMGFMGRGERLLRLAGRVAKDILKSENKQFRRVSLEEIRLRLLTRRRRRLERWKRQMES